MGCLLERRTNCIWSSRPEKPPKGARQRRVDAAAGEAREAEKGVGVREWLLTARTKLGSAANRRQRGRRNLHDEALERGRL